MNQTKPYRLLVLACILVIAPFLLMQRRPVVKAADRIRNAYLAADKRMHQDGGLPEVEWFLGKLKEIDVTDAPRDVQYAFTVMVSAVEANAHVRRTGGNTNFANERVSLAKRKLLSALEQWRGQPF